MSDEEKDISSEDFADSEEITAVPDDEADQSVAQKKAGKLVKMLEACEKEKKEYLENWQRARADFVNYKNEEGRRLEDTARFVITGLIEDVLPVLDSFDLAFQYKMAPEMERGVLLIRSQFMEVLKKRGLEEISVKAGKKFNTAEHESVGETESESPPGTVAEVVQKGYIFRGRVLRPVRVRLSKS